MKKSFNKIFISSALIVAVLVLTVAPALRVARADALTNMKATLSTLKVNTVANQTVMFRLSSGGGGVAATETITLTYGSDFAIPAALDFEDIDVSSNHVAAKEMIKKSKQTGVPVIEIDDKIIVGFDQEKIKKALNIK